MTICFATQNRNKLTEVQALLPEGINLVTPAEIGCEEELPETQLTLEGNSRQKAQYLHLHYGVDCFADDTGLEIEALNGEPGVFSARYAGVQKKAEDNITLVLKKLEGKENRKAHFKTVITMILDGEEHVFEGVLDGEITETCAGVNGFGYDPIFKPSGYDVTLAQMTLEEKNKISHRALAFNQLKAFMAQLQE
jgi:XTP/dITP diphosphohydrolase